MVRRLLANCGLPVVALHRVRYGGVLLDALELDEGEAAPVEGEALQWALALGPAAPPRHDAEAAPEERPPTPSTPPAPPAPSPPGRRVSRGEAAAEATATPRRGVEEEYEEAGWREWSPRPNVVEAVMLAADAEWEEAIDALRGQRGDVVAAIEALKNHS